MSNLKVVDLPRADEISSADMNKVAGGMSCENGLALAGLYLSIAGIARSLGEPSVQANFAGKADGVMTATCP
jgi:hypothetical protein